MSYISEHVVTDFQQGDRVVYVPGHANGDPKSTACERGVVSSTNDRFVFARYGGGTTAQATDPRDLLLLREVPA